MGAATAGPVASEGSSRSETQIPARLDRLPWSSWHRMILIGLGTVWILDGLEVTIVGNIAGRLSQSGSGLHITSAQVTGAGAASYVAGACVGALFFGWLTDRFGRKRLFMVTLGVYLAATALTGLSTEAWMFFLFRGLTGLGIGGEYAAINSAIDELIPKERRGRIDLIINGTFWLGAAVGALLTIPALNTSILPADLGWRLCFALGVILGTVILLVRRNVPESPRWLVIHGRDEEAERIVSSIERRVREETDTELPEPDETVTLERRGSVGFVVVARTVFGRYPGRATLGMALFIGQAFLYNAITFGFGSILGTFFKVPTDRTGYFYAVIAVGNLLGPISLGRLFDVVGRKPMIAGTYIVSGVLLAGTAYLFHLGDLDSFSLTLCWSVVLFFASAGASSAYLTVSEIFPMETRSLAIAFFYAIGTAAGGISGPILFSHWVSSGRVSEVVLAFLVGAAVMVGAGLVELTLGVAAERRSLESIAAPLNAGAAPSPA